MTASRPTEGACKRGMRVRMQLAATWGLLVCFHQMLSTNAAAAAAAVTRWPSAARWTRRVQW
jgi:hypothetical protein